MSGAWDATTAKFSNAPTQAYRPTGGLKLTARQIARLRRFARITHELEQQSVGLSREHGDLIDYRSRMFTRRQNVERDLATLRRTVAALRGELRGNSPEADALAKTEEDLSTIDKRLEETAVELEALKARGKRLATVLAPRRAIVDRILTAANVGRDELGINWTHAPSAASDVIRA